MSGTAMVPQFTPDIYVQAGLNSNISAAADGNTPITQEGRDQLGELRNKKLNTMQTLAMVTLCISSVAVIVGIAGILLSSPNYNLPYSLGGGCISGFFGLCISLVCLKIVQEGGKISSGDDTSCMKCLLMLLICLAILGITTSMMAMGFGGLWALIECLKDPRKYEVNNEDTCIPNKDANIGLSLFTIVFCLVNIVLMLSLLCIYCFNQRVFRLNSRCVTEMQRMQTAQQVQISATQHGELQTGYYPDYYGQTATNQLSHQHERLPFAPPAPPDSYQNLNIDDSYEAPPPSYEEVMKI